MFVSFEINISNFSEELKVWTIFSFDFYNWQYYIFFENVIYPFLLILKKGIQRSSFPTIIKILQIYHFTIFWLDITKASMVHKWWVLSIPIRFLYVVSSRTNFIFTLYWQIFVEWSKLCVENDTFTRRILFTKHIYNWFV